MKTATTRIAVEPEQEMLACDLYTGLMHETPDRGLVEIAMTSRVPHAVDIKYVDGIVARFPAFSMQRVRVLAEPKADIFERAERMSLFDAEGQGRR